MKKYGVGEVLSEETEDQRKTAAANWSEKDEKELAEENKKADRDDH